MTRLSLLASATRLPAWSAASVASSPAAPTTALTTMSTSGSVAASTSTSGPVGNRDAAIPCRESRKGGPPLGHLCRELFFPSRPPVSATTRKWSRWRRSTSSVLRPIEPVEPSTATPERSPIRIRPHQIAPKNRYSAAATGTTK